MLKSLMDTDPVSRTTPADPPAELPSANRPSAPPVVENRRQSPQSPLVKALVGPEGLYAGARWVIYVIIGFTLLALFNSILYRLHHRFAGSLWWNMAGEVRMMLAAILPGFVMARIEGRSFGDFGLPARGAFGRNFWAGAVWGIGALTVFMLALRGMGVFSFGTFDLHGMRLLQFALFYAVFFLIAALFEEFLMRGYSQWVLTRSMNFWPAAVLLSILFGAIHGVNPGEEKVGLVAVVAIGLFFCFTLWRTGTLWWAVGFHMAWDWGESYLYSVPDSGNLARGHLLRSSFHGPAWLTGGSVGPEGSYLVFVVIGALWALFGRAYPEVKYRTEETQ